MTSKIIFPILFSSYGTLQYSSWPVFNIKYNYKEEYAACFSEAALPEAEDILARQLPLLHNSSHLSCRRLHVLINSVYCVSVRVSPPLRLHPKFQHKLEQWLAGDETLLDHIHHQRLIHVTNHLTGEEAVYNPVRSHRPQPPAPVPPSSIHRTSERGGQGGGYKGSGGGDKDEGGRDAEDEGRSGDGDDAGGREGVFAWVDELSERTQPTCDFCNVYNSTAEDKFGRGATNFSVRVSNTFKLERWHLMVVTPPPHHNPIRLSRRLFIGLLTDAHALAEEIVAAEPDMCFPHLAWDTLPAAGASQVHPHVHVLVAPNVFYGYTQLIRQCAERFYRDTGGNLFSVLLEVHRALGLVVTHGDATALALLSGKGQLDIMFLSERPGKDLFELMYFATKAYHNTFSQLCYSMVLSWTPEQCGGRRERGGRGGDIPAMARLVGRGDCTSAVNDFSSFEIFQLVYRRHTPWEVIAAVRRSVEALGGRGSEGSRSSGGGGVKRGGEKQES